MKITALITHYYPERLYHIKRIIQDLKNSTRPPDTIMVFNNDSHVIIKEEGVICINSTHNLSGRAKYIACLLDPADYYVLLDNDITVGRKTIEHLISVIPPNSMSFCTAQQGVLLNSKLFHERKTISEFDVDEPVKTDTLIGSFVFCSFSALVKMLEVEPQIRLKNKQWINVPGDDILLGFANTPIIIYPARGDECVIDLSQEGVACYQEYPHLEFMKLRDSFTQFVKKTLQK